MRIKVLRRTEYKGCPVYIIRFATVFQYLFYFKGDIYQDHCFLNPRPIPRILYFFHLISDEKLYNKQESEDAEGAILNAAVDSIDKLTEIK